MQQPLTWGPQRDTTTHYVNVGPDGTYPGLRAQAERTRECRRSERSGIDTVHPDQLRPAPALSCRRRPHERRGTPAGVPSTAGVAKREDARSFALESRLTRVRIFD